MKSFLGHSRLVKAEYERVKEWIRSFVFFVYLVFWCIQFDDGVEGF